MAFDLLFKGATLVDGTGAPMRTADVGVRNGKVVAIGKLGAGAARTVAADGLVLAPGFIDGHTHMDAQVAWDPLGSCSCWHGVTSVFMGNCGFALAPCKPDEREWIARCLEAVEDIPTEAMLTGIDWTWESFPEYLQHVQRARKSLNYGVYLGHSALRMYAMGERGAFSLEQAVRMLTLDNASAWGLADRGRVVEGVAADLVLFDADEFKPCIPTVETDLPGGARRLVQKAEGIAMTVVNGAVTLEHGEATGNHPGVLLRGPLWDGAAGV